MKRKLSKAECLHLRRAAEELRYGKGHCSCVAVMTHYGFISTISSFDLADEYAEFVGVERCASAFPDEEYSEYTQLSRQLAVLMFMEANK